MWCYRRGSSTWFDDCSPSPRIHRKDRLWHPCRFAETESTIEDRQWLKWKEGQSPLRDPFHKQQLTRLVIVIIDQKSNTFLLPGGHRARRRFSIKSSLLSEQCSECSTRALRFIERPFAHQRDKRRRLKRDSWSPRRGIREAFTFRLSRKNVVECIWKE